jgi:hypothetical protein
MNPYIKPGSARRVPSWSKIEYSIFDVTLMLHLQMSAVHPFLARRVDARGEPELFVNKLAV